MKVNLDYDGHMYEINQSIMNMPKQLYACEDKVLRKTGNVIKKHIERLLHDSDVESRAKEILPSNYDGSRPYTHMKDDVHVKVKKDAYGNKYASVRGGKFTGYKWHMIDRGHIARDGSTFVPGNNFIGRAMAASEGDVNKIIDDMLKKVVG